MTSSHDNLLDQVEAETENKNICENISDFDTTFSDQIKNLQENEFTPELFDNYYESIKQQIEFCQNEYFTNQEEQEYNKIFGSNILYNKNDSLIDVLIKTDEINRRKQIAKQEISEETQFFTKTKLSMDTIYTPIYEGLTEILNNLNKLEVEIKNDLKTSQSVNNAIP